MPIQSFKMGPGTLKFGPAGATDASCQVRACQVVPTENVERTDPVPMLCGEELPAEEEVTFTYKLTANIQQDLATAGFVAWTWTNKGTEQLVEFIPSTAAARKVTGTVRIVPLAIGGDAKVRPTSDLEFSFTVDPVFADV